MIPGWQPSPETVQRTREHFADIGRACIADAVSGETRVNDLPSYAQWREDGIRADLAGEHDHSFTFRQRAYWLETGISVALLS
jgi:hypothetical protein